MADPGTARAPNGQFTTASAAVHGRGGAAERERRFLERFASPETRRRQERGRLRWAIGVIHLVYGPPRRPRRRPRNELAMAPLIAEALDVLGEAMGRDDLWSRRLRAVETVIYLVVMMPASKVPGNEGGSYLFGPPIRSSTIADFELQRITWRAIELLGPAAQQLNDALHANHTVRAGGGTNEADWASRLKAVDLVSWMIGAKEPHAGKVTAPQAVHIHITPEMLRTALEELGDVDET